MGKPLFYHIWVTNLRLLNEKFHFELLSKLKNKMFYFELLTRLVNFKFENNFYLELLIPKIKK